MVKERKTNDNISPPPKKKPTENETKHTHTHTLQTLVPSSDQLCQYEKLQ